jgi:hypothetical protein
MRRAPAFSSLDFESPRASDQRYGGSRQSGMLWSAQFRETPVSTASGSLSVLQGSSICSLPPNLLRSISSASGRRLESIGIHRLNFSAGVGENGVTFWGFGLFHLRLDSPVTLGSQAQRKTPGSREPNEARGILCPIFFVIHR